MWDNPDIPARRSPTRPTATAPLVTLALLLAAAALPGGCGSRNLSPIAPGQSEAMPAASLRAEAGQADGWAGFERAWSCLEARDYRQAEQAFQVWLSVHAAAEHPRTPKALLWLGYSQEQIGQLKSALMTYAKLEKRYPLTAEAALARRRADALLAPPAAASQPAG